MSTKSSMGDLQIYTYTFVICLSSAIASTWPDFRPTILRQTECPRNMACRWALCPWTKKPIMPSERTCFLVDNDVCSCGTGDSCLLSDIMDPGVSHIKYEYRCMSNSEWPATRSHFFNLRRRRRGASIGVESSLRDQNTQFNEIEH